MALWYRLSVLIDADMMKGIYVDLRLFKLVKQKNKRF